MFKDQLEKERGKDKEIEGYLRRERERDRETDRERKREEIG